MACIVMAYIVMALSEAWPFADLASGSSERSRYAARTGHTAQRTGSGSGCIVGGGGRRRAQSRSSVKARFSAVLSAPIKP